MARPLVDQVGLSWLITVRWTTMLAAVCALLFGASALHAPVEPRMATILLVGCAVSNLWLARTKDRPDPGRLRAGTLVSADVLVLTWCLADSGGIVNPASIVFLVDIVVAALVLGPTWTWVITGLSVSGYGLQLLFRTSDVSAALAMHPQIAEHVRGMWVAFLCAALLISVLVARLATAVDRRDRALEELRTAGDHAARMTSLATLTAGAAHELSTPLGTIAVAAGELARGLDRGGPIEGLRADVALIRAELLRCKTILDAMSGRADDRDPPAVTTWQTLMMGVLNELPEPDRQRVRMADSDAVVTWPVRAVTRAIRSVVRNALDASEATRVRVEVATDPSRARVTIADDGPGMAPAHLARATEPFYTTKPTGRGMGLGLFVTQTTIEHLGGDFAIASSPVAGTVVTMSLPLTIARVPE